MFLKSGVFTGMINCTNADIRRTPCDTDDSKLVKNITCSRFKPWAPTETSAEQKDKVTYRATGNLLQYTFTENHENRLSHIKVTSEDSGPFLLRHRVVIISAPVYSDSAPVYSDLINRKTQFYPLRHSDEICPVILTVTVQQPQRRS